MLIAAWNLGPTLLSREGVKLSIAPRLPAAAMVKMRVVHSQKGPEDIPAVKCLVGCDVITALGGADNHRKDRAL